MGSAVSSAGGAAFFTAAPLERRSLPSHIEFVQDGREAFRHVPPRGRHPTGAWPWHSKDL